MIPGGTPAAEAGRAHRGLSLASALLASCGGALPLVLMGALAVQLREDLGLEERALGVAAAAYFVVAAMTSAAGGRLADRIGWERSVRLASLTVSLCLLGVAGLARDMASFLPLFLVGAVGNAIAQPASNLTLAREMPPQRYGLSFGVKQSANPVAGLFAGASVPLIAVTVGWRWAFVAAVAFPLAASLTAPRRGPEAGVRAAIQSRMPPGRRGRAREPYPPSWTIASLVALAVGGGMAGLVTSALATFVVLSAVESGVAVATAGGYIAAAAGTGLVVRVAGGWVADRTGSGGIRPAGTLLGIGTLGFVFLASGRTELVLPGMLIAYGAGWGWPGLFQYGVVRHHLQAPGRATGIAQAGLYLGAGLGPVAFGFVAAGPGYTAAWGTMAALSLVGAIVLWYTAGLLETRDADAGVE